MSELMLYGMECPFGEVGPAGLVVSHLRIVPPLSPLMGEWGMLETALMLCQHCSAVAKTIVCYHTCLTMDRKHWGLLRENDLQLSQLNTVSTFNSIPFV